MERLHIFALFIFATICNLQYATATVCVDSCVGKINGNYQYCPDCGKYVACSNGYKYIMSCPANLVWDDNMKRCEWTSSTCTAFTTTRTNISVCVDSCVGKINGNYQYCPDCGKYVACSNGYKYIMPCPANLVWDDNMKRCEWTSSTCPESTTTRTTISDLPTGTDTPRSTINTTYTWDGPMLNTTTITTPTITPMTTPPIATTTSTITTHTVIPMTTPPIATTTSTMTTPITTTLVPTTPNVCHFPPPTDCCIRKQMRISLEDDVPEVFGKVPFVNVMELTNGKERFCCDAKILLNVTFQKHRPVDPCQGCTNVPQCGKKMLRIDLEMAPNQTGVSFHVGDSRTNYGFKGDASTQENDAQFHSFGYQHRLYGRDKCPNMYMVMTGLLSYSVTKVTIFIGNEFIRVSNNLGYVYELCSECLFALNGQSDSQGPINEDIFIGLNRIIASSSYREGTGVCSAVISWACPWNC